MINRSLFDFSKIRLALEFNNKEMEALVSSSTPEGPIEEWMVGNVDEVGPVEQQDVVFTAMTASDAEDVIAGDNLEDEEGEGSEKEDSEQLVAQTMTTRSKVLKRPSTFSMQPAFKPQTIVHIDDEVCHLSLFTN